MYGGAFATAFTLAITWAIFGIIGGILIHQLLGAYIEGAIGAIESIVVGGLFLVFLTMAATSPTAFGKILFFVLMALLAFAAPWAGRRLHKRADRIFYSELADRYREAIARDPRNLAARESLANVLYREGRLFEAVAEFRDLVRISPNDRMTAYRLAQLEQELAERHAPPAKCPGCGHMNPPGRKTCENCESNLKVTNEIKQWLVRGGLKQVLRSWAVGMGILTLVLAAASLLSGPGRIVVSAIAVIIVIGAELIYVHRSI